MNKICISGRVATQPRYSNSGSPRCEFLLANDIFRGSETSTGFYKMKGWGKLAEQLNRYITVGAEIFVTGRLEQWRYEDESGQTVYCNSIVIERFDFGRKAG